MDRKTLYRAVATVLAATKKYGMKKGAASPCIGVQDAALALEAA